MLNTIIKSIAPISAFWFVACTRVTTVAPTYLFSDASKSIRVVLYDNRVIRFSEGEYTVSDKADSTFLCGTGIQYTKTNQAHHPFQGTVGFREIKELQIIEAPSRWQTTPAIIVGTFIVGFIIAMSTINFHHI